MRNTILEKKLGSTKRVDLLIQAMEKRSWADRSSEWFTKDMFKNIGKDNEDEPVIIRRALAIKEMLSAMTNKVLFNSDNPHYKIREGELIVGVITLGSLGLGKSFPNYLTDDEKGITSISAKTEMGLFGHDSVNYDVLLSRGLNEIIDDCNKELQDIGKKLSHYNLLREFSKDVKENHHILKEKYFENKSESKKIEVSLNEVFEDHDETVGNRFKTYKKELGDLFKLLHTQINNDFKAKGASHAENKLLVKKIEGVIDDSVNILHNKRDFYHAVKISCEAVIKYANEFSDLAYSMIQDEPDPDRKIELNRISKICSKVPAQPAENFHEALQSIYFFHLALHSSMNQLSLGRLDQILQPYYKKDEEAQQLELFECFLIKCAERLILDPDTFVKQDHVDYGSNLLTVPVPLDQWAESNEFLQNIIIGGKTRDGNDAVNDCSYLILKAFQNTKLFTPTLNARLHKDHVENKKFLNAVAECLYETKNGMPVIGNDEALIPAMSEFSGIPIEEARDYVIDGCWEPLLNGSCDWTFRMFNMLTVVECALNGGATLSSNPILLRGEKLSYETPLPALKNTNIDFEGLKNIVKEHIKFFTDQAVLSIYKLYLIDQAVNPNPLYSALLKGCMKNGRDKTWGGADYKLAGVIPAAVPNAVNTLAAIQKWVYEKKEIKLSDVLDAFRNGYVDKDDVERQAVYNDIKTKFQTQSPKFGNNEEPVNNIMQWMVTIFYNSVKESQTLAEEVFLNPIKNGDEKRIVSLRALAGYAGNSLKEEFGEEFTINITAGMGTFELFDIFGGGNAASADRENIGDPIARNFAPQAGSTKYSIGHLLKSFSNLGLNRFAGGVITDICLEEDDLKNNGKAVVASILEFFMENGGNMLSVTIADRTELEHIYKLCQKYKNGDKSVKTELKKYERVNVRVGGFQMPFITLPEKMQETYIKRPISSTL